MPLPADLRYPPIADYALLADCHSAALVSTAGSIDWACLRRFDASSVFGRLLDWDRGGHFSIHPVAATDVRRQYVGDSLVLETTVETRTGRARVLDAFAMKRGGSAAPYHQLLRVIEGLEGDVAFDVVVEPRFDYGELRPWIARHAEGAAYTAVGGDTALIFTGIDDFAVDEADAHLEGRVTVATGERRGFGVQSRRPHHLPKRPCSHDDLLARLDETLRWWERWSAKTEATGPYAAHIRRSATVLKGLTCAPTGAIVAAPTTSLPEEVGGERNWDYRYSWVRDSTLSLAAMALAGHEEVARGFRDFLMRSAAGQAEDLQILYGPYGARHLPEVVLDLEGYRGSRPVRIGNGAARQVQHDVYGHILDAATLWRETHDGQDPAEWRFLRQLVDRACTVWREPDKGIWEVRCEPRHFTASKVMLWVALDRGIRTVEQTGLDDTDVERWRRVRDEIRADVEAHGVSADGSHFVQSYGSTEVDAALLMLPMVGFVAARDPRMVRTVERIREDLSLGEQGFIRRYRTEALDVSDGLEGHEGAFLICSFWLVDILALQGAVDEATKLFERLLAVGSDLGLYAEEYDPGGAELLGNYPQAFTHLALITSAHQLEEVAAHGPDARPAVRAMTARLLEARS